MKASFKNLLLASAMFACSYAAPQTCNNNAKDCCNFGAFNKPDPIPPVEVGPYQCDVMIRETQVPLQGNSFSLQATPGVEMSASQCTWILPNRAKCPFTSSSRPGDVCAADSSVVFAGNLTGGQCLITVRNPQGKHEGVWKCILSLGYQFIDNVRVTNPGMSQAATLGVSISFGLLGLILLGLLLARLFCPTVFLAACACCLCGPCRRHAERAQQRKDDARAAGKTGKAGGKANRNRPLPDPESPSKAAPLRYKPPYYDAVAEDNASSASSNTYANDSVSTVHQQGGNVGLERAESGNYESVQYTHVRMTRPNLPAEAKPKTARKISQQSFGGLQQKDRAKKGSFNQLS